MPPLVRAEIIREASAMPVLRSFIMPDNFIQQPENTQNYNRYAYVLNNPLMYTDP